MNIEEINKILPVIKDVISILSSVVLMIIAILGLQTWKKQLKGNTEYEIARNFLLAVYKMRDAIQFVRNPVEFSSEQSESIKKAGLDIHPSDPDWNYKSQQAKYQTRWKNLRDSGIELNLVAFEAETIWGYEVREKLDVFYDSINKLNVSIIRYLRHLKPGELRNLSQEDNQNIHEIIFSTDNLYEKDSIKNPFSLQIIEAIENLENFVKPRLKL